jgi:hypothetical protein
VCLWDNRLWDTRGNLQGDHAAGNQELRRCLQSFGRPLPTSKLELLSSTMWQIVRQILHRMWFGKWLAKRTGGFFVDRLVPDVTNCHSAKSAHSFRVLLYCNSCRKMKFVQLRYLDTWWSTGNNRLCAQGLNSVPIFSSPFFLYPFDRILWTVGINEFSLSSLTTTYQQFAFCIKLYFSFSVMISTVNYVVVTELFSIPL